MDQHAFDYEFNCPQYCDFPSAAASPSDVAVDGFSSNLEIPWSTEYPSTLDNLSQPPPPMQTQTRNRARSLFSPLPPPRTGLTGGDPLHTRTPTQPCSLLFGTLSAERPRFGAEEDEEDEDEDAFFSRNHPEHERKQPATPHAPAVTPRIQPRFATHDPPPLLLLPEFEALAISGARKNRRRRPRPRLGVSRKRTQTRTMPLATPNHATLSLRNPETAPAVKRQIRSRSARTKANCSKARKRVRFDLIPSIRMQHQTPGVGVLRSITAATVNATDGREEQGKGEGKHESEDDDCSDLALMLQGRRKRKVWARRASPFLHRKRSRIQQM